jgi:metal-responsive CopG/Arc/MetJ family transcriptional regulator
MSETKGHKMKKLENPIKRVNIALDEVTDRKLDELVVHLGDSRSEVVRLLINAAYESLEKAQG